MCMKQKIAKTQSSTTLTLSQKASIKPITKCKVVKRDLLDN